MYEWLIKWLKESPNNIIYLASFYAVASVLTVLFIVVCTILNV